MSKGHHGRCADCNKRLVSNGKHGKGNLHCPNGHQKPEEK